jgi:hypothetical protein
MSGAAGFAIARHYAANATGATGNPSKGRWCCIHFMPTALKMSVLWGRPEENGTRPK